MRVTGYGRSFGVDVLQPIHAPRDGVVVLARGRRLDVAPIPA
jgi:hypothetical protein